jgi:transcriptional regulator with XRE-family HTH domain
MTQEGDGHDSHTLWLQDIEYRQEFGSEGAKLEMAAALVYAREVMNMTQSALAELAGTSQAYIARLESGDANPTIGNIGRLFACMGLKPSIQPIPMEPFTSMEPVIIKNLGTSEASVEYSQRFVPPDPNYSVRFG